jgi:TonB family C-terminal domain
VGRLTFRHGLAISVALHALAVGPVFLYGMLPRPKPENRLLQVEMFGMIAERQTRQKELGAEEPPPQPRQAQKEAEKKPETERIRTPRKEPPKIKAVEADSPVRVADQTPPATGAQVTAPPPPPPGEQEQQIQQTVRARSDAAYAAMVGRKVRERLIYPQKLRNKGLAGTATVGFIVATDGTVRKETLRVTLSSGSQALDESALATVLAAAPFDPPLRETDVAVDVVFGIAG